MNRLALHARKLGNALSVGGRITLPQILLRRCFRFARGKVRIPDFDGNLSIDLTLSEHMERRIFWMGYYNREIVALLDLLLREGMVVVDVGANIGEISMVSANRVGVSGRVFAFEPIDDIADEFQANITRNQLPQVTLVRCGVSDVIESNVPIYASCGQRDQDDEHRGLGSLFGEDAEVVPIQHISVTTLDAYFDDHSADRVDLIKIDIEGAELHCLKGGARVLEKFKPMLIIEVQEQSAGAAKYRAVEILDFLMGFGYTFHRIGSGGRLTPIDASGLRAYQNILCMPVENYSSE